MSFQSLPLKFQILLWIVKHELYATKLFFLQYFLQVKENLPVFHYNNNECDDKVLLGDKDFLGFIFCFSESDIKHLKYFFLPSGNALNICFFLN